YSPKQAAEALGVARGTVRSWLSRGRRPIVRRQATRRGPAIDRQPYLPAFSKVLPGRIGPQLCCQAGRRVTVVGPMLSVSSDRWHHTIIASIKPLISARPGTNLS